LQPGSDEVQELNNVITTEEILKCIKDMSNGKAAGIDGVVVEMLKSSSHTIVPFLKHLYNAVLTSGNFPAQWCQAVLVPIHKKGSKSDPNNYRGIALYPGYYSYGQYWYVNRDTEHQTSTSNLNSNASPL